MKYKCVHCGKSFIVEEKNKEELRCPYCLRMHGVEEMPAEKKKSKKEMKNKIIVLAIFLFVILGAGFLWWLQQKNNNSNQSSDTDKQFNLTDSEIEAAIQKANVDRAFIMFPVKINENIKSYAQKVTSGKSDERQKVKAIYDFITKHIDSEKHSPFREIQARRIPPLNSSEVLDKLLSSEEYHPYSLELSSLIIAMARSVDLPVIPVEIYNYNNDKAPLDPTGMIGHIGALYLPDGDIENKSKGFIFDAHLLRNEEASKVSFMPLSDIEFIGYASSLKSAYYLEALLDSDYGYKFSDSAVKLAPESPTIRGVFASSLFQSSGDPQQGMEQLDRAMKLRDDAPRRINIGAFLLLTGKPGLAAPHIQKALELMPEYGFAHAISGILHISKGETREGETELELAGRLDPDNPRIEIIWADIYLHNGEGEKAVSLVKGLSDRDPENLLLRQKLAQIYEEEALFDDMRSELREIIKRVPEKKRDEIYKLLQGRFGMFDMDESAEAANEDNVADAGIDEPMAEGSQLRLPEVGSTLQQNQDSNGLSPSLQLGPDTINTDNRFKLRLKSLEEQ